MTADLCSDAVQWCWGERGLQGAASAVRRSHFLKDNALAVRGATERVALELSAKVSLLVALLRPALLPTHGPQLAGRVDTTRLACSERGAGASG